MSVSITVLALTALAVAFPILTKLAIMATFTGLTVAAPRKTWFKIATLTPLLLDVLAIFSKEIILMLVLALVVLLTGKIGISAVQADTALDQNQKLLV